MSGTAQQAAGVIGGQPPADEEHTMAGRQWDTQGEARRALEVIIADPYYGPAALSKPAVISNLLQDLLPDQPREAGLLVAAAHADLAATLRRYQEQGLDVRTATRLAAPSRITKASTARMVSVSVTARPRLRDPRIR